MRLCPETGNENPLFVVLAHALLQSFITRENYPPPRRVTSSMLVVPEQWRHGAACRLQAEGSRDGAAVHGQRRQRRRPECERIRDTDTG